MQATFEIISSKTGIGFNGFHLPFGQDAVSPPVLSLRLPANAGNNQYLANLKKQYPRIFSKYQQRFVL